MSRGARLVLFTAAVLACAAGCTETSTGSTTTMSRPGWLDRTTLATAPTTSTSTTAPGATTTLPPDQRPKGTGWSPPEGLTDEQIKDVGVKLFTDANNGAGSQDPVKYRKALMATRSDGREQVEARQKLAKSRNAEDVGTLEYHSTPTNLQVSPKRVVARFAICIRDNTVLTEVGTGRVVDDSPLPHKVKALSIGLSLEDEPDPADGSRPGPYWAIAALGGVTPGEIRCPAG